MARSLAGCNPSRGRGSDDLGPSSRPSGRRDDRDPVANLFDTAMDALVTGLKTTGFATTEPWNKMISKLKKVVGTTFEASEHTTLDDLRKAVDHAAKNGMKEGTFLAAGGEIAGSSTGATMAATADVQRCAALKMLRHTYYHAKRGNHKMHCR